MRLLANNAISMVIGDTATIQVGITGNYDYDRDRAVFIIFDPLTQTNIVEKILPIDTYLDCNGIFTSYVDIQLISTDTISLPTKTYNWNLKAIKNIKFDEDGKITGDEVLSVFGHFSLPKFFLRPQ